MNRLLHPQSVLMWAMAALAAIAGDAHGTRPCESATTTIIIVRHADRAGQADSLSEAGVARAQELARVLATSSVRAIYHSDTKRTRATAAPVAAALKLEMQEYPARDVNGLIEEILKDHLGETVLVVGHSNTVPMIISAAIGPILLDVSDDEFDGLFIVPMQCPGEPSTLNRLEYGAPSP